MAITITSRPETNWLLIEGKGVVENLKDEMLFANQCYEEILKHNSKKVLLDQRGIEFKSSIVDQYGVVTSYKEFPPEVRNIRIALIVKPKEKELHESWELFANNRGYPWKVFIEMEAAVEFLQM